MSKRASIFSDLRERLAAACTGLLHPSARAGMEADRQLRLLQVLLGGAVSAALATMQVAFSVFDKASGAAAVLLVFGLALLPALALIASGKRKYVEPLGLCVGSIAVALLVAFAGGAASPFAALGLALALEAGWISRTRKGFLIGLAAAGAAVSLGGLSSGMLLSMAATPAAWHWLLPLAYVASLAARHPMYEGKDLTQDRPGLEDLIGAAIVSLQRNGDVVAASDQVQDLLGVAPEMLLGSGLFERIHVADRVAYLSALADVREGAGNRMLRLRVRVPGNTAASWHYSTVVANLAGDGQAVVLVLREDAANAELEDALARAKEAADGAMLARNHFLASVSHELRTPLNAIMGFSDVLANEMFGAFANEKQREYAGLIRNASSHLLSVVNAVLDVSKVDSGSYIIRKEPFVFADAVKLSVALSEREAEAKSVVLKNEIDENVGIVECDRGALQQVLINLISNAVKFTPSGEVKVTAWRSGDRLHFTVSDTGIGISADDLEQLGTPFMQVQNGYARQGTGLGLALVKGLVRLHGGALSIESAPGNGTRVHVCLPAGAPHQAMGEGPVQSGADWKSGWNDDALRKTA